MNYRRAHVARVGIAFLLWLAGSCNLPALEERPASFDCATDRTPLASIVCGDPRATAAERRAGVAYLAVYFSLDENGRARFRNDHLRWVNELAAQCVPSSNPLQILGLSTAASRECVTRSYALRTEVYRKKLRGPALEEINLSDGELRRIQKRLLDLNFLAGKIDGMFGAGTRQAIRRYQISIDHVQSDFLSGDERNMLLAPANTAPQTPTSTSASARQSMPAQSRVSTPTPPPEVSSAPAPTGQSDQNHEGGPSDASVSGKTAASRPDVSPEASSVQPLNGQSGQDHESKPSDVEAASAATVQSTPGSLADPSTKTAAAEKVEEPAEKLSGKSTLSYFTNTVLLILSAALGIVLVAALFLLKYLHHGRTPGVDEGGPVAAAPSLTGLDEIPANSSQLVAAETLEQQQISDHQVDSGTPLKEDAIAGIIADLVRKGGAR